MPSIKQQMKSFESEYQIHRIEHRDFRKLWEIKWTNMSGELFSLLRGVGSARDGNMVAVKRLWCK